MLNLNLKGSRVLVTGSEGFFGKHVCNVLKERGAIVGRCPHEIYELTDFDHAYYAIKDHQAEYVISLAANTGGIVYNGKRHADLFYDNIHILTNVLKACWVAEVRRVVNVTTSCSYPDGLEILREEDYWNGRPNSSVEFFGLAKRASEAYGRALHKQYGLNVVTACVTNLYGEHDDFSENGKVVSNLIRKFAKAKQESIAYVECLGTGNPLREFMYVGDAAESLVRALELYGDTDLPINIGTGKDISIKELAQTIADVIQYKGEIRWDVGAGDGQMKKLLDVTRMKEILHYEPTTSLQEGLRKTILWYMKEEVKVCKLDF